MVPVPTTYALLYEKIAKKQKLSFRWQYVKRTMTVKELPRHNYLQQKISIN